MPNVVLILFVVTHTRRFAILNRINVGLTIVCVNMIWKKWFWAPKSVLIMLLNPGSLRITPNRLNAPVKAPETKIGCRLRRLVSEITS